MLCIFGPCPCMLVLLADKRDQEVAGTQMDITWKARAALRRGVDFKSKELAANRERCLSIRKCLKDWGAAFLDADHWDLQIGAYRTII